MRRVPEVGMDVLVVELGRREPAHVQEVLDGGRTVVVDGRAFDLHPLTGRHVLAGGPYYGPRLVLGPVEGVESRP